MPANGQPASRPADGLWRRLVGYSTGVRSLPPAAARGERALYGLGQPVLGLHALVKNPELLAESLKPALLLGCFCAFVALFDSDERPSFPLRFYAAFVFLAPVPSILFANYYARLAASAHTRLGLGPCEPRRETLWRAILHAGKQAVVVAMAVAPMLLLLGWLPLVGKALAAAAGALWALHWVVIEAFDSARVRGPALEPAEVPDVWFVRSCQDLANRLPLGGFLLRFFARICRWLSFPWREEIALVERHPGLVLGFSMTTAILLATPVLNLLFRPIIIIASVHLLSHLRSERVDSG